jgi:myosin heavy subunit
MAKSRKDQTFVISGESGAGKSEVSLCAVSYSTCTTAQRRSREPTTTVSAAAVAPQATKFVIYYLAEASMKKSGGAAGVLRCAAATCCSVLQRAVLQRVALRGDVAYLRCAHVGARGAGECTNKLLEMSPILEAFGNAKTVRITHIVVCFMAVPFSSRGCQWAAPYLWQRRHGARNIY